MENVNIPQDSIWAQKDEIDSKKVYKKVNFDTKNYLNVKLKDSEVTRTVTIRLLPFTPEGGSPFHLIHSHGIKVNKELAPQSAKPYKAYVCCKHTTELHEKYGNKCAICDAHDEFSRKMKTAETEEKKKMYSDLEFQTRKSESWIVRCIERGKEDEGVKFWKFNVSKKNDGIYDKLFNLFKLRNDEALNDGDKEGYNIFDLYKGKDLVLTLTKATDGKVSISIADAGRPSALSKDPEKIKEWVNDPKQWTDVYGVKTYDYLKVALAGEVPYFDQASKTFISKKEFEAKNKQETEKTEQEIIEEAAAIQKAANATEDEELSQVETIEGPADDLPF